MNFIKISNTKKGKPGVTASLLSSLMMLFLVISLTGCSTISSGLASASKFIDPNQAKEAKEAADGAKEGKEAAEEGADAVKDLQDKLAAKGDGKKKPQQLRIGFIPFDNSFEIGETGGKDAVQALAQCMTDRGSFKPSSLKFWLGEEVNKVTAVNIQQIMERARATDIPIDSICYGRIFKAGDEFGLYVEVYPLIPGLEPTYYLRSFSNFTSLYDAANEIVAEMENRAHVPRKPLYGRNIYIKTFKLNFYTYTNLRKGEGSIIQIPYLNVDGTSYKTDDVFFSSVLLYHLHSTRLFNVWNNNIRGYVQQNPVIPSNMDIIVDIDLDVSLAVNMLTVRVTDGRKKQSAVFKYQYPFRLLNMEDLNSVFRENVKIIVMHLLSDEEKKHMGVVNLESIARQKPVFCEGYFLGYGKQYNLLFPSGASSLEVDNKKYKIFVSPFTVNNHVYDIRDSYLLDLKK